MKMAGIHDEFDITPLKNLIYRQIKGYRKEMDSLYNSDNNVIKPENEIPESSRRNYLAYKALEEKIQNAENSFEEGKRFNDELKESRRIDPNLWHITIECAA